MSVTLCPLPFLSFRDNNGNPLVGGQLYTYAAGTTTLQPSYSDYTGTVANTNPVILNGRGEASVWLTPTQSYKVVLEDVLGNVIWTQDHISTFPDPGSQVAASGYQKFASGIIVQWGVTPSPGVPATGSTTVTLPIPFPTAGFTVTATDTGSGAYKYGASFASTSTIIIYANGNSATGTAYYIAIGH